MVVNSAHFDYIQRHFDNIVSVWIHIERESGREGGGEEEKQKIKWRKIAIRLSIHRQFHVLSTMSIANQFRIELAASDSQKQNGEKATENIRRQSEGLCVDSVTAASTSRVYVYCIAKASINFQSNVVGSVEQLLTKMVRMQPPTQEHRIQNGARKVPLHRGPKFGPHPTEWTEKPMDLEVSTVNSFILRRISI